MCVRACMGFHSIFKQCSHLMTFYILSIYGHMAYVFVAGKTRLSIARRNLSYLHLYVFERLTCTCAMLDTCPSTCPGCIPEYYPVTAGMPAPYRHTVHQVNVPTHDSGISVILNTHQFRLSAPNNASSAPPIHSISAI